MGMISDFDLALKRSLRNIHDFSERMLRFVPSIQQADLFDLVQFETFAPIEHLKKRIAVKSGNGPGKTAASTVVMLFRLLQKCNNKGMITAPTRRQVQDVWISELTKRVVAAPVELQRMLDIQATRIRVRGFPKWEIQTATSVKPENLQGVHDEGLTILTDEASGIERKIWPALKGTTTQPENLLVAIGNPNERDTEFFDMFNKDVELYHTLTWNSAESPNVDPAHIEYMRQEYGEESDIYRIRVLGEFPLESANVVIRYEDLLYATRQTGFNQCLMMQPPGEVGQQRKQFGIDLARFGGDESIVVARFNSSMVGMRKFHKKEPSEVVQSAFEWCRELGWDEDSVVYCVDAGGMGQGVLDQFYSAGKNVHEFHTQGKPRNQNRFHDKMTEAYWQLRLMTRSRRIHLKEDDGAFQQLVSRQYRYQKNRFGKEAYRLESKDEYLTRLGTDDFQSPDRADAIAMAFYPYASTGIITA